MSIEQPNLFASVAYGDVVVPASMPDHDGATYDSALDKKRLNNLYVRVFEVMRDGQWRTLAEIVAIAGGSEGGVGARLRDARKFEWGGYTVDRRRRGNAKRGLFEYRLVVNQGASSTRC